MDKKIIKANKILADIKNTIETYYSKYGSALSKDIIINCAKCHVNYVTHYKTVKRLIKKCICAPHLSIITFICKCDDFDNFNKLITNLCKKYQKFKNFEPKIFPSLTYDGSINFIYYEFHDCIKSEFLKNSFNLIS
jgi:hypothetical protein